MAKSKIDPSDPINALKTLGLDIAQAKLYITLLDGPSTVAEISKATDIGRTKVYAIVDRLCSMGLIKVVVDQPRTFQANHPGQWANTKVEAVKVASKVVDQTLSPLYNATINGPDTVTLQGRYVVRKTIEMMEQAKESVEINVVFLPKDAVGYIQSKMDELRSKGVVVRSITKGRLASKMMTGMGAAVSSLKSKVYDPTMKKVGAAGIVVVDGKEILIGSNVSGGLDSLVGIWSRNKALVELHENMFNLLYDKKDDESPNGDVT
jgi:sugar-specific transcriptional regulator TrmB